MFYSRIGNETAALFFFSEKNENNLRVETKTLPNPTLTLAEQPNPNKKTSTEIKIDIFGVVYTPKNKGPSKQGQNKDRCYATRSTN
jgi:hypothetical protein